MGLRVICKVEAIVRGKESRWRGRVTMPVIQPAERQAGDRSLRQDGPRAGLRIRDRHDRDFVVQPTPEEVVTDIARQLRSYKQLPKNLYQIQTKS